MWLSILIFYYINLPFYIYTTISTYIILLLARVCINFNEYCTELRTCFPGAVRGLLWHPCSESLSCTVHCSCATSLTAYQWRLSNGSPYTALRLHDHDVRAILHTYGRPVSFFHHSHEYHSVLAFNMHAYGC